MKALDQMFGGPGEGGGSSAPDNLPSAPVAEVVNLDAEDQPKRTRRQAKTSEVTPAPVKRGKIPDTFTGKEDESLPKTDLSKAYALEIPGEDNDEESFNTDEFMKKAFPKKETKKTAPTPSEDGSEENSAPPGDDTASGEEEDQEQKKPKILDDPFFKHMELSEEEINFLEQNPDFQEKIRNLNPPKEERQLAGSQNKKELAKPPEQTPVDGYKPFKVELDPEVYDEGMIAQTQGLADHVNQSMQAVLSQIQKMGQTIDSLEQFQSFLARERFQNTFDGLVSEAGPAYKELLGEGGRDEIETDSVHMKNRIKIIQQMEVLSEASQKLGRPSSLKKLFNDSLQMLFPKKIKEQAREELGQELKQRAGSIVGKPTGRPTGASDDPVKKAQRYVRKHLQEHPVSGEFSEGI